MSNYATQQAQSIARAKKNWKAKNGSSSVQKGSSLGIQFRNAQKELDERFEKFLSLRTPDVQDAARKELHRLHVVCCVGYAKSVQTVIRQFA